MNGYYPKSTNKIMHKGKLGNIYRLDGIEKCIQIAKNYEGSKKLSIVEVSVNDEASQKEAVNLVNNIHAPDVINAYKTGLPEQLANSSGVMWQADSYNYVLENALTAKLATEESFRTGFALAIEGGGHHAEKHQPFGFCLINTMAIAAQTAVKKNKKTAVVDLDTHYSNGCFDILKDTTNVKVLSLWNQKLDKWKKTSANNIWEKKVETVEDYFKKLEYLIAELTSFSPDLVIYHLGLDVMDSDRMGGVSGLKEVAINKRDLIIQNFLSTNNTPVVVFLGGAYIDWSKGEKFAKGRREQLTNLFCKEIELFIPRK